MKIWKNWSKPEFWEWRYILASQGKGCPRISLYNYQLHNSTTFYLYRNIHGHPLLTYFFHVDFSIFDKTTYFLLFQWVLNGNEAKFLVSRGGHGGHVWEDGNCLLINEWVNQSSVCRRAHPLLKTCFCTEIHISRQINVLYQENLGIQ